MKKASLKKNFIYSLFLTFANMCFPLITAPFLSLRLGAEGLGRVDNAQAILSWLILFSSFGISRYAIREIARVREDKEELTNVFWNLLLIQFILTLIFFVGFLVFIFIYPLAPKDFYLFLVISLGLLFNIFSLEWFFQGIEDYGYITIRNILVKVVSIIATFMFIREFNDYVWYALILILVPVVNNTVNFIQATKYVNKENIKWEPKRYFSSLRVFFYIALVVALYTQLDRLILGQVSSVDLAFYSRARQILNIGFSITTALVTVLSPRAAYLISSNPKKYREMVRETINYIYLLGIPITIGMILLAKEAMYFLGREEFIVAYRSLQIIAPISLIGILGSWISGQILLPNRLEESSFRIQLISVFLSVPLNFLLIPRYTFIGASISWLTVELFLFISKAMYVKYKLPDIKVNYFSKSLVQYSLAAFFMALAIGIVKSMFTNYIITLIIATATGAFVYFIVLLLLKETIFIKALNQILRKLKIKKNI